MCECLAREPTHVTTINTLCLPPCLTLVPHSVRSKPSGLAQYLAQDVGWDGVLKWSGWPDAVEVSSEELLLFEHDHTEAGLMRSVRSWSSLLRGLQVVAYLLSCLCLTLL